MRRVVSCELRRLGGILSCRWQHSFVSCELRWLTAPGHHRSQDNGGVACELSPRAHYDIVAPDEHGAHAPSRAQCGHDCRAGVRSASFDGELEAIGQRVSFEHRCTHMRVAVVHLGGRLARMLAPPHFGHPCMHIVCDVEGVFRREVATASGQRRSGQSLATTAFQVALRFRTRCPVACWLKVAMPRR